MKKSTFGAFRPRLSRFSWHTGPRPCGALSTPSTGYRHGSPNNDEKFETAAEGHGFHFSLNFNELLLFFVCFCDFFRFTKLSALAADCQAQDPAERPTATQVWERWRVFVAHAFEPSQEEVEIL
jgi:hypothetical protein